MKDQHARTPEEGPAPASRAEGVAEPTSEEGPAPASRAEGVAEPSSSAPSAKEEKKLQAAVGELERERDEYLELARRTKADFENYRKRVDREASQAEARGRARLARDLLSVLDNLERALAAAEPVDHETAPSHLAEGVRLVYEELAGILSNAGIESFEPEGE